ncbi:alpha/beta hydrolase [Pseudokineococcus sp. 1T1Z-3]|uniref:alpha/beta hydrolase n=1 Tax=Pseudokineococcus sp. 1T1Z-3 TaxID=3132745 RepID=UPI0030AC511C
MPSPAAAAAASLLLLLTAGVPAAGAPPAPRGCLEQLVGRAGATAPVTVLGCDARGRGRAVVALGDLGTAERLVVLVPGVGTDLRTLVAPRDPRRPQGGPLDWAGTLVAHAPARTAVVLWVDWTTPRGVGPGAATGALARAAVPALVEAVEDLQGRAGARPRTTVVGHSYGAVVVATAAAALDADALVLLASPGARASRVDDLGTTADVWAARSPSDWVRHVPPWRLGDVGHGLDPTDAAFGARVLPADDVVGHDGYLVPGTGTFAALLDVVATGPVAGPVTPEPADDVLVLR